MAEISSRGNTIHTSGDLPDIGTSAPRFSLVKADMRPISSQDLTGTRVVLNIFPSVDTRTCATSVREFNARAAALEGTEVICVSADLPFAMQRFCGAEGIDAVTCASTFRNPEFLDDYGVRMVDGYFADLAARAVVVLDADGTVVHAELVADIGREPDYDAALAALG